MIISDVVCEVDSCSMGNRYDAAKIYVVASRNTDEACRIEETDTKHLNKKRCHFFVKERNNKRLKLLNLSLL
ncbi:hypothetical protein [Ureibacillus sinduriensis]|uniref:Uncharacterized protein n=1 Tax=Ureibacillus sinduriensis BLB-1 = JCM 15800 TaxID=1384057 RepID=A0A0A3HZH0_9BACL|nr:hypothetical protein [Ureibacillus sinduriensis]KGR76670.1 hypothetical protein CD33_05795 [Ureibacillus sinduriensis BLB-1 = JCM 15800]